MLQGAALADLIAHYGWNRIGVIFCDDSYCQGLLQDLQNNLAQAIVATRMVNDRGMRVSTSAKAVVTAIQTELEACPNAGEDAQSAVLVLLTHDETAEMIVSAAEQLDKPLKTFWKTMEATMKSK